jgi:hypothetical protein
MVLLERLWRHKATIITTIYFIFEIVMTTIDKKIDRLNPYYLAFVGIVLLTIIWQAVVLVRTNRAPA